MKEVLGIKEQEEEEKHQEREKTTYAVTSRACLDTC